MHLDIQKSLSNKTILNKTQVDQKADYLVMMIMP